MFNWLFPSTPSNSKSKCNHRGSLYTAWGPTYSINTITDDNGKQDILSTTYLEKCNKCGAYRLVKYDTKAGTVTITKQTVVDDDVA